MDSLLETQKEIEEENSKQHLIIESYKIEVNTINRLVERLEKSFNSSRFCI